MTPLDLLCTSLERIAPLRLAESWDNVGLLVGDRTASIRRVMTCLTITPDVVAEAEAERADLIVTHHPLPFRAIQRITTDSTTGSLLLRLMRRGIAVYSAHTAFDSAEAGINQMWADTFELADVTPLVQPAESERSSGHREISGNSILGAGRAGVMPEPMTLEQAARVAAGAVGASSPRVVGDRERMIRKMAFACGSGGGFLSAARDAGCDAMITGEATFHTCLEAEAEQIGMVLLGHFFSERFAMERLAEGLHEEFSPLTVWASRRERDPITTL
jgi:dinuclear metal center YbgI/SA1388 family protein